MEYWSELISLINPFNPILTHAAPVPYAPHATYVIDIVYNILYNRFMIHTWSKQKNEWLQQERNLSFELVEAFLLTHGPLAVITGHSGKHAGQSAYLVMLRGYVHIVPFIDSNRERILCTIIPSRKYQKLYEDTIKKTEND